MIQIDIVESSVKAYRLVWAERHYLLRLSLVPFIIKMICFSALSFYGWEMESLRRSFVMLPSYFADGWLLSHVIRLIYFGHRWPFRPSGNMEQDMVALAERARGVMAGTVTYVVIYYLAEGVLGGLRNMAAQAAHDQATATNAVPATIDIVSFFGAIAALVALGWLFRMLWLYIPAALNRPIGGFLRDINRYIFSFHMIGIWLMCLIPVVLVMSLITAAILGEHARALDGLALLFFNIMRAAGDMMTSVLATAGICYGFLPYLSDKFRKQA